MSVAQLSSAELGTLVAIAVKLKLYSLADACSIGVAISAANRKAWNDRDSDDVPEATSDEIELYALRCLATNDLLGHFGPVQYNCRPLPAYVAELVTKCEEWQDCERRRIEHQAENDLAFAEVGPLPLLTEADITPMSQRVIYAEFRVDESDCYSDYHGHRTVRRVVLGFANGKREDFRQLRKCAATFEPTKHLSPGCDEWHVSAYRQEQPADPKYGYLGDYECLRDDSYQALAFSTEAESRQFVADLLATSPECQPGYVGCVGFPSFASRYGFECRSESYEHRENYSMGGGNYLGSSRHGGWIVRSTTPADAVGMEWHNSVTTPPKSRKAEVDTVSVVRPDIQRLAEVVELRKVADMVSSGSDCEANRINAKTRVVPGRVYTKVDVGTSGLFMVENSTGSVYGIKAYGHVNRRHYFGCVSEVTARFSAELAPTHPVSVAMTTMADSYSQNV